MGHKKRGKYGLKNRPQHYGPPVTLRKKKMSMGRKMMLGIAFVVVLVVVWRLGALSTLPSQPGQTPPPTGGSQPYPQNVAPAFFTSPTLTSDRTRVTIPSSYVESNKLVFVDLKLETPTETLPYQGRTVPLSYYKNGGYLPIVLISTPSGKTVAGIRTCEPCGSFSFHIVKGTNLKCDVCGSEWNVEDFAPVSGGCGSYPPPKLTNTINADNVEVDLSALPIQIAA